MPRTDVQLFRQASTHSYQRDAHQDIYTNMVAIVRGESTTSYKDRENLLSLAVFEAIFVCDKKL